MPPQGTLALLLHAHLPFVRHPEHERFLEEDWLYEAITDCYLPLLEVFETLVQDGIPFQISVVLTPTLLSMLSDDLLRQRYRTHLDRLIELAEREVVRTRTDPRFHALAQVYLERFRRARRRFVDQYRSDLVAAFGALAQAGNLEIFTSAATHAFLPLLQPFPQAVAAQIRTGVRTHRRLLGRQPEGFWLPECGYYPGLDGLLARQGARAVILDAHGLLHAQPRPLFGVFAPVVTPAGLAAFGRDLESSRQVWSAREGYPGHADYREYYRDIGYDLDLEYIRPYIQPTGARKNTGIKYHRITGPTSQKLPYDPALAAVRIDAHAGHFVGERVQQLSQLGALMDGPAPVVVAPYDAELFGHWWFEGPQFLGAVLRKAAGSPVECLGPLEYLRRHPIHQATEPSMSSWGQNGYCDVWLNPSNDWIYNHLHHATAEMIALAGDRPSASGTQRRALNQAARELMLAQASDWAFMLKMGTTVDYAAQRTREHLQAFLELAASIRKGKIDLAELAALESRNNLFPDMDYRIYRDDYHE